MLCLPTVDHFRYNLPKLSDLLSPQSTIRPERHRHSGAESDRLFRRSRRTLPDSTSSMSETRARNLWLIESYHKRVAARYPAPAREQLGIIGWMVTGEFRKDVDRAIDAGDASAAARMLAAAWELEPGSALAGFVSSRYDRIAGRLGLLDAALGHPALVYGGTALPLLKAGAYAAGIALEIHLGEFNAYAQEILDPESALYRFQPDAVVLAVQTRDVAPELVAGRGRCGRRSRPVRRLDRRVSGSTRRQP